jgi:hypothetical protein
MYVPAFPGLAPSDLIRSRAKRAAPFPFSAPRQLRFYRARNAIYHLFRVLPTKHRRLRVIAPDYYSGNEVLAMRGAGAMIHHARVDRDMRLDPAEVERLCRLHDPDVLFVIHYLGWPQPIGDLASLCRRRGIVLVEDCALSLLSEAEGRPLGSFGDFAVFCLYKTLPVPNGALLVANGPRLDGLDAVTLRPASAMSVFGRLAELLALRLHSRADRLGGLMHRAKRRVGRVVSVLPIPRTPVGDIGFEPADVNLAMSRVSTRLVNSLDFEAVRRRRVDNFRQLDERIGGHATRVHGGLAEGLCPLTYPIFVHDKHAAARALERRGIEAVEMWNDDPAQGGSPVSGDVRFLRRHVLELPVHQDLTPSHVAHTAREVVALRLRMM